MKFDQLIEFNMIITFVEKSYSKNGEENIPRPFSENSKFITSLDQ